ncbi:hypothetical protein [Paenibacillus oleatilyticus]|uniref:Uncharacterized protein n=1 Tax=Paenibacillus oleatilyticus TaxID=2594886 RepID=A0ABV4V660_9BACL|nr:hypothetical protein [Paenibacillus oleatilyticus]MBU7317063.1 hypothetical protein [Paenibacillus oleatilyticus]
MDQVDKQILFHLQSQPDSTRSLEEFGNQCDKYGIYTILIVMSAPIDHKFLIQSLEETCSYSELIHKEQQ